MSVEHSRSNPFGLSGGRLLVLLLVVTVLLAQGALGSLHISRGAQQFFANQVYESPAPLKVKGEGAYKNPVRHLMHVTPYYAVLLVSFLGLLLKVLEGARSWNMTTPSLTFAWHLRPFGLSSLPREPTAPLLQVLRL